MFVRTARIRNKKGKAEKNDPARQSLPMAGRFLYLKDPVLWIGRNQNVIQH